MSDFYEHLERWERPHDYGGFSPDGDFLIYSRTRDSETLVVSNYERAFEVLRKAAALMPEPEDDGPYKQAGTWVYDFRAGHWGFGWVEHLMVRADAPDFVLKVADEIVCALASYPVLDESDYSRRLHEQAEEVWGCFGLRDRMQCCVEHGLSPFAARRDSLPEDAPTDLIYELGE